MQCIAGQNRPSSWVAALPQGSTSFHRASSASSSTIISWVTCPWHDACGVWIDGLHRSLQHQATSDHSTQASVSSTDASHGAWSSCLTCDGSGGNCEREGAAARARAVLRERPSSVLSQCSAASRVGSCGLCSSFETAASSAPGSPPSQPGGRSSSCALASRATCSTGSPLSRHNTLPRQEQLWEIAWVLQQPEPGTEPCAPVLQGLQELPLTGRFKLDPA